RPGQSSENSRGTWLDAADSCRANDRRRAGILARALEHCMIRSALSMLGAVAFAILLAVFVTWPQALHMRTSIFTHHDPYFSIWRISWIAHGLVTSPFHLFDANIFYPAKNTLAFSDATLLEGLLGAPFLWMHVSPVFVYNALFLLGFIGSAIA